MRISLQEPIFRLKPRQVSMGDLARFLRLREADLVDLAANCERLVRPAEARRIKGKVREISAPTPLGRLVLKRLLRFLQAVCPAESFVHGGSPGKSCFTAARTHRRSDHIVTRDVKNCYPSVSRDLVRRSLENEGFAEQVAEVLSALVTPYGRLPQGSNASGAVLNVVMRPLDRALADWCRGHEALGTRTYDDIVVSASRAATAEAGGVEIERNLGALGLEVSTRKRTRIGTQSRTRPGRLPRVHSIELGHGGKVGINPEQAAKATEMADGYVRACRSCQPRSIRVVAKLRERLSGWITQCSMADLSPVRHLRRQRDAGDRIVRRQIEKVGLHAFAGKWWLDTSLHPELTRIEAAWLVVHQKK